MTREARIHRDTPLIAWLRAHPLLDSQDGYDREDLDIIWFHYIDGKLMLIEEKANGSRIEAAKKDTIGILDQALKYAATKICFERYKPERTPYIKYYGFYLIQFENLGPEDGGIKVNGVDYTKEELLHFFQFRKFPKEPVTIYYKARWDSDEDAN